jgi:microcystin-dependent protein
MRGRTLFGADYGSGRLTGLTAGSIAGQVNGATGGEEHHTLTGSEMPQHSHDFYNVEPGAPGGIGGGPNSATFLRQTGLAGGNWAHNNMPPGIAMGGWIMKL